MKIALRRTGRGFIRGEFLDHYGEKASIQESSLATEACLWLGSDVVLTDVTGEVHNRRLHLTQDMARELVKLLEYFVKHGGLPEPADVREP